MKHEQTRVVRDPQDLDDLQEILDDLHGKRFLAAHWSYGDELRLEFGEQVSYKSPLLAGKQTGEMVLGTRATAWTLAGPDGVLATAGESPEASMEGLTVLKGISVIDARASYPNIDLTVKFANRCTLSLFSDCDESHIAAWELFTPGMVLIAGPGKRWTYTRSGFDSELHRDN